MTVAASAAGSTRARASFADRSRVTPRAAVLAAVLVALLVYLAVPLRAYVAQRAELSRLRAQRIELERQNAALQRRVRTLNDPAYLEDVARECLGMVRPGEIAFVVIPKGGRPVPPTC